MIVSTFCCDQMKKAIDRNIVSHFDAMREYDLILTEAMGYKAGTACEISHCPWCGTFLGKTLNREYFDILEKEYGIEIPDLENFTNVPEEFRTDEWWKKRGL